MKEESQKIWRVNLKINTKNSKGMEEIQKECLLEENEKEGLGYIAMGWRVNKCNMPSLEKYQKEIKRNGKIENIKKLIIKEYQKATIKQYEVKNKKADARTGYINASNMIFSIQKGDICFTRSKNNIYYIGRIMDALPTWSEYEVDGVLAKESSWIRKVYWYKLGTEDEVPSSIVGWLMEQKQRTITYTTDDNKEKIAHLLINEKENRLPIEEGKKIIVNENNYMYQLSPHILEELVCLYLQVKLDYLVYISSWKKNTKLFEYVLVERNTLQTAYVQTKINQEVDLEPFNEKEYEKSKVYVFSAKGYKNDKNKKNIIKLTKDFANDKKEYKKDIYEFYKENIFIFEKGMQVEMKYYKFE